MDTYLDSVSQSTPMLIQSYGDSLTQAFMNLSQGVVSFIPQLVMAVIIFLAGWVVGSLLGNVVATVIRQLKIDSILDQAGIGALVAKAGFKMDIGRFLGALVEWFVVVTFLIASFDVLKLEGVNMFLREAVLGYIPQVIVAVLVLLVGSVVAHAMEKVVVGSARAAGVHSANMLGTMTRWAIWIFAFIIALSHLGIAVVYLQTLFTGVVVALSVAFGLAFGLGGQDAAAQLIDRVRHDVRRHE